MLTLYKLFATPDEVRRMEEEYRAGGMGYGNFKQRLFEAIWSTSPPCAPAAPTGPQPDYVDDVLRDGARRANETAGSRWTG